MPKFLSKVTCNLSAASFAGCVLVAAASTFSPAEAASITFGVSSYTGNAATGTIKLEEVSNGVRFTVDSGRTSTSFADIRGVFFNIKNESLISGLNITGANINALARGPANQVQSVGGANLQGDGNIYKFDVGVEIGENGLKGGSDDISTTTFVVSHNTQKLTLEQFATQSFGVRYTSVGATANSRGGSSKLIGFATEQPKKVPEPLSLGALLLVGSLGLGLAKKRQERETV